MSTYTVYYNIPDGYDIIKEYYMASVEKAKEKQRKLRKQYFHSAVKIHRRHNSIFVIVEK